ncbi:MAG TPA: glycosyltransferase [Planctomycetota bacterium]|nr:glycosyltransferase [Planctomycetota bacterium]
MTAARSKLAPGATAVISSWNRKDVVRENLVSLRAQKTPFAEIVVVDNHSTDGTLEMLDREFPEVRAIVMPHSGYGACETFNIGFASVRTELTAILDDDVVLPPDWLEKLLAKLATEPETTAMLSTKVVEPGMPDEFVKSDAVNRERFMATFRGCGTLARTEVLAAAGGYDERFFIYGNERDLASRILALGYRIKQFPEVVTFHKTPFGMKKGKRSLYFHARNFWLYALKNVPLRDLAAFPFRFLARKLRRRAPDALTDATGAIGAFDNIRETPGGWWIVAKATIAAFTVHLPYCLKRRAPVHAPDFELPLR